MKLSDNALSLTGNFADMLSEEVFFKSKSYIALKEARESLYGMDMLHRNNYIDDKQYNSLYEDCE